MQSTGPPASTTASTVSLGPPSQSQTVSTIPSKPGGNVIRPSQQTSYHVPRGEKKPIVLKSFEGAAAVASIAMPRPSTLTAVRPGPTGSLVSIRGSTRALSPAPHQQPQQAPRTRPANSPAHSGSRPVTPQRSDTPRPPLVTGVEKAFGKNAVPVSQGQARTAPLVGQGRVATIPALSSQQGQSLQIVTQAITQAVTLSTSQPGSQASVQTPIQVVTQATHGPPASMSQPTLANVTAVGTKPRPISQTTQAGTVTALPTNPPAVVLATPARLASPGLIGVQTGPARLAVATALPTSGARIVSPSTRVPQGRTVTYTSNHQVLQSARLPPAPVRLGAAGRGVVSLHPVVGVTPLKPAPGPVSVSSSTVQPAVLAPNQTSTQSSTMVTAQATQPAPLRALPAQSKVVASAVVTVAAVGAAVRPVVATVPAAPAAAPASTPAAPVAPAPPAVSKPGTTHLQTLATVAARPGGAVAVAGPQVRAAPGQPGVYIQAAHRASPGPAGDRTGAFPIQQTAYFYEAPSGSFQVANVSGRTYAGGPPYIVQATAARPVVTAAPQVHGIATATGAAVSTTASSVPAVTSVASSAPGSAVSTITANVVSTVATAQPGHPPRFNSIMVLDPSRTSLPIHAVVPAEGGATGTTYIAADGSLLPVQGLPVSVSTVSAAQAVAQAGTVTAVTPGGLSTAPTSVSQESTGPTQVVTQVASVVSQAVTSSSTGHLPMQIQVVQTPVHIQMHPQGQLSQSGAINTPSTATSVAVPMTLAMSQTVPHQVLSHPVAVAHATLPVPQPQGLAPTPTTPVKPNASPRPSILRKRDNEGSPMKAQKNLMPLLQSMGSSNANPITVATPTPTGAVTMTVCATPTAPPSPPSPPKRPDSGGPQSSGSTTISATSSPGQESPPPGAGQPPPSAASITAGLHAAGLHGLPGTEMSPRKKPRKQQLTGNELQEHKMSDDEMEFMAEGNGDDFPLNQQPQEPQQLHQQVLQQQQQQQQQQAALPPPPTAPREFTLKRPNISLLSSYRYSWKSRNNHFLRHSDVKPKDERRPSVNELASQRYIYERLNGWKVHHLTAQMEDLADVESQVCEQLEAMLGVMERKAEQDEDKDVNRVNELIKGNMQRSRIIADQLIEAKSTVMKIFDHKPHVNDIIKNNSGKRERIFKKREKS